jgi:biopolymer transport protein ExbD
MTRVKLVDTELGTGDAAFARLDERIREILTRGADPKGEINAAGDVPHGHVVRTIDSFMRAGIHNITFVGTKKP